MRKASDNPGNWWGKFRTVTLKSDIFWLFWNFGHFSISQISSILLKIRWNPHEMNDNGVKLKILNWYFLASIFLPKNHLSCHGFIVVKGVRGEEVGDGDVDEDDVAVGVQGALPKTSDSLAFFFVQWILRWPQFLPTKGNLKKPDLEGQWKWSRWDLVPAKMGGKKT